MDYWGFTRVSVTAGALENRRYGWGIKNIPLSLLPRTIQDAIFVTRQLGIRYLWVDALCIIQDSPKDKMREIEEMEDIYNRATLTIAAANADSCSRGFLSPHVKADIIAVDRPWDVGSLTLAPYGRGTSQEPLYLRCWPFQ